MKLAEITEKVKNMLVFRGHNDIAVKTASSFTIITGGSKPGRSAIALIDPNESYAGKLVSNAISQLAKEAAEMKLSKNDSAIYVHAFENRSQRQAKVDMYGSRLNHYFESFQYFDFVIDHDQPHATRNWRILNPSETELLAGKIIDKPPQIYVGDIMIRYLGARVGEYVAYTATNIGEVGPFSHECLIQVTGEAMGTTEIKENEV